MKRNSTSAGRAKAVKQTAQAVINIPDFAQLADAATSQVEHRSTLDFLRLIRPHGWSPDDVMRFGDRVKRMADALPLPWVPDTNGRLGIIRVYPVPLMQWVYSGMAVQYNWPTSPIALDDAARDQRDELRRHEGAKKHLEAAAQHTTDPEILAAMAKVTEHLEKEAQRLRGDAEPTRPNDPPPLRVV